MTIALEPWDYEPRGNTLFCAGKYINVKSEVESYLERMFYNLTTVALHNWKTYGEMRAIASHR